MSELAREAGGVWWLPGPDDEGSMVLNAHPREGCSGACALHAPSLHWAEGMPLRWRHGSAGGEMLRVCPHGAVHDDPDDLAFRLDRGLEKVVRPALPARCDCPCDCEHAAPF